MVPHARAFADERNLLTVGQHNNIIAGQNAARGIDGPFHKRNPGQLFNKLVRNDGIFLDGRYDDAAFFHVCSLLCGRNRAQ